MNKIPNFSFNNHGRISLENNNNSNNNSNNIKKSRGCKEIINRQNQEENDVNSANKLLNNHKYKETYGINCSYLITKQVSEIGTESEIYRKVKQCKKE